MFQELVACSVISDILSKLTEIVKKLIIDIVLLRSQELILLLYAHLDVHNVPTIKAQSTVLSLRMAMRLILQEMC